MSDTIKLYDRIKELSYTMGLSDISLAGSVAGFSSFSSAYNNGDNLFYAITDGSFYEIGSGIFNSGITGFSIVRFPMRSSNNNQKVSFNEGVKEIYATYPATHAVYQGSGIAGFNTPQNSGLAYWKTSNMLQHDPNLVWDDVNGYLGINTDSPDYGIDLKGVADQSIARMSGVIVGSSGIYFPPRDLPEGPYLGGRQTTHYEKNELDKKAYDNALIEELTGTDAVLQLSGVANQYILFKKQNAGFVFAGPPSGCVAPCSPGYPSFRPLTAADVPDIANISGILNNKIFASLNNISTASGALNARLNSVSGLLRTDLTTVSGIANALSNSTNLDICQGRLTLESNSPITNTDQINKSTVYYAPLSSTTNKISLYNGTSWQVVTFTEKSLTFFALANNSNYDIFGYLSGSDLQIELGSAWTNSNTRSEQLTLKDNVLCKSGDLTRRYLGTIRTTSSSTTEDSESKRFVWNAHNRVEKTLRSNIGSSTWTYNTNQWRPVRNIKYPIAVVNGYDGNGSPEYKETIDIKAGVVYASDSSSTTTTTTTTTTSGPGTTSAPTTTTTTTTSGPGTTSAPTTTTTTTTSAPLLFSFGSNSNGQIGDGTTVQKNFPTGISTSGWLDIACGSYHSVAIRNDGKLFCWGDSTYGQLARDLIGNTQYTPQRALDINGLASDINFYKVFCGTNQTFALDNAGRLWIFGRNTSFQLGIGNVASNNVTSLRLQSEFESWVDIAAGDIHTIGIKVDGTLWGWGSTLTHRSINPSDPANTVRVFPAPIPITNIIGTPAKIVSGAFHNLMLTTTGDVYAWGNNQYGQTGTNSTSTTGLGGFHLVTQGTNLNGLKAIDIACGAYHSLILDSNSSVWGAGRNQFGQLGLGNNVDRYTFNRITNINTATKVYAGAFHSFVLTNNNSVYSFGMNAYGQLGLNSTTNSNIPITIPNFTATKLAGGFYHTVAIK